MKDFELEFLTRLTEQSEEGNLNWNVENIGGHNREFSCSFKHTEIFTITLITPTVASPRAQLLVISHLPRGEGEMELIRADTKTPLIPKEEIDLLVRLKNSAINYVNVIKEQQRVERIKNGINYLELKGKSTEVDYTTGEHWQFAKP